MNTNDVIIAPASSAGTGAISVFRISGKNLKELLSGLLPLEDTEPRRIRKFLLKDLSGRIIDEITFIRYVAPASYTGEDMVEIFSHGGTANTRRILEFFASRGLRIAEPGEFTFRALLNGKLSLTKAESIDKICKSENIAELDSALEGYTGKTDEEFEDLYRRFTDLYGDIIAEAEFSEDETDISRFRVRIEELAKRVEELVNTYERLSMLYEGADIVIAGKTNVGKSSLFNRLVGEERSIVTEIEGTTRDVVDKKVYFGNIALRFADTAGLRESGDVVELLGQKKTHEEIKKAALILYMTDVEKTLDEADKRIISEYRDRIILVVNKIDLSESFILEGYDRVFYISAKYDRGTEDLKRGIRDYILSLADLNSKSVLFSRRQYNLFVNIRTALLKALKIIDERGVLDIIISELSEAKRSFESLTGNSMDEDIYSGIFSRFCIGK